MKTISIIKVVFGSLFIIGGLTWSVMFPKTADIFRPDTVASIAVGTGLILPGVIILFFKQSRALVSVLTILLLWSLLLNVVLFSWIKTASTIFQELANQNTTTKTQ